ncbi:PKD domain-containing protein [Pseudocolwellia agarivorans]|uniref:PKD domain-containing protein n=1 Tax=Pseudocolwellia agarivorans TaxID=1911682 RepID=UPI00098761DB|nr:hypothetical protein [Pseudocolwellia agarivorans]
MNVCHSMLKVKFIYVFFILLLILSCGESGVTKTSDEVTQTSDEVTQTSDEVKIISIESDGLLYEASDVSVTGNILAPDSNQLSYQWNQISGVPLTLRNTTQQTAMFTIPNLKTNEEVTLELTVKDTNNATQTRQTKLTLLYINTPPIIEIEPKVTVNELSEVVLSGNIIDEEGDVTSQWQQSSGTTVEITPLQGLGISFETPKVSTIETLTFELTAVDTDGAMAEETITVTVLPYTDEIPQHVLLLTNDRINQVKRKIAEDDTAWNDLTNNLVRYFNQIPYNSGEYAGSFALAFYVSGEMKYMERVIELLEHTYFSEPDIGWKYYQDRNAFRSASRWAIMGYTWIKLYIPLTQQIKIENILSLWGEYWLEYIDFENDFKNFRIGDSDEVTSLAENLTLLGYALNGSPKYIDLSQQLLNAGDALLNRFVVDYYMKDIMAGGAWAEGSDYGPATQAHWMRIFMINKDQRDIPYPINYAHDALQVLIHQTLANYSGVYKYGDEERATDYEPVFDDNRYLFAFELMGLLEDEEDIAQLTQWFNTLLAKEGYKTTSITTHFQRLLHHDPKLKNNVPVFPKSTINISPGVGIVSSRSNWTSSATNLYFINREIRVHHEHRDALSYDLAYKGNWITKEKTGYDGVASSSLAHNTILIENADKGSSNPTLRAAGTPKYLHISDDQYTTLISADATDTYNMSGYYATNYAELVNRQLAFIKPNIVIAYDHVKTFPDQIKDLIQYSDQGLTQGMSHTRWVKTIQHFQAKPERQELSSNTFVINDGKNQVLFQNIWPINTNIEVVDEQKLWADIVEYQIPENQKKWHLSISNDSKTPDSEIINIIQFASVDEVKNFDQYPIVMTKENGLIKSNNIIGVAVSSSSEKFVILFNQSPNKTINNVEYILPSGYDDALVYGIGIELK